MDKIMLGIALWVRGKMDDDWDQPLIHDLVESLKLGPVRDERTDTMGVGAERLSDAIEEYIGRMES